MPAATTGTLEAARPGAATTPELGKIASPPDVARFSHRSVAVHNWHDGTLLAKKGGSSKRIFVVEFRPDSNAQVRCRRAGACILLGQDGVASVVGVLSQPVPTFVHFPAPADAASL